MADAAGSVTLHRAIESEKQRCECLLKADVAALDQLLDERLRFTHSNGATDSKVVYLQKFAAGQIVYRSVEWFNQEAIELPFAVILTGRMQLDVSVRGVEKRLNNSATCVWTLSQQRWQLTAFQSTPLPS